MSDRAAPPASRPSTTLGRPRSGSAKLLAGLVFLGLTGQALAQSSAPAGAPPAQAAPKKPAPAKPAAPAPAAAADDAPSRTSATYEDWVVRCERPEGATAKVCEVSQTLQIGDKQQGLVAQIAFGRLKADTPLLLVLQLPAGVWLPAGARFTYDEKAKPVALSYKFCIRACIADIELSAADAAALAGAKGSGKLEFQDRSQTPISLPISFNGLATALAARDKM
ncbi:invasion associated locus B family protein [Roseixanthobacter glucoisosaccharinicivorans]|uniref:invasion associated locus B family protein n=1 Tax=Roseixanthobacter glucoisosaccharinicivorans TaxID=3119923 RepID=UPI003728CCEA